MVPIGSGTPKRMPAALVSGSIDANMVNKPDGVRCGETRTAYLGHAYDIANVVPFQNTVVGATQKNIDKDGDHIVRFRRSTFDWAGYFYLLTAIPCAFGEALRRQFLFRS